MEKISYALGLSIGNNFKTSGINSLNLEDFKKGVEDVLNEKELQLSYDEAKKVINVFFEKLQEERKKLNKTAGEEFLRINKQKAGIITLPSGLQYQILTEGNGPKPKVTDNVKCHYHGTLIDGREFDSSVKRGQPATFGLNQVIPGWTEALQLMPAGSKWKLFLPSELAYGSSGAGDMIEPDSTLIFEVELLEIV
ncbi:MAG: FKBP-type peptidyl-prolyl cis-trans isomerase [Dysgonamonadaceae bacterium]|jgi:FKBP-type peptidyl-prolyl cis-trans isomerase FklB|nr:FKBP-type peptidyl-prolyl cis-trans isomerase [Dysgonamonadaceae bacterium]